ncbi:hypothetical protein E8E12_001638 [Didymella heteroderae]|uniref:Uncharacterized protein n=1 Tax=Didymella heteroderae TaxID=1769908 RepID=A0A9P4WG07_9PLEO|nr:hypothetical protein E8E12_001638 [Didymella heteroderae]
MASDQDLPIPQAVLDIYPSDWGGDVTDGIGSLDHLSEIYGEIFQVDQLGQKIIVCSSHRMIDELCNPDSFGSTPGGMLEQKKALNKDQLLTANPDDKVSQLAKPENTVKS